MGCACTYVYRRAPRAFSISISTIPLHFYICAPVAGLPATVRALVYARLARRGGMHCLHSCGVARALTPQIILLSFICTSLSFDVTSIACLRCVLVWAPVVLNVVRARARARCGAAASTHPFKDS